MAADTLSLVTVQDMRDHLAFTDGVAEEDNLLIAGMILAAQAHIERLLGYRIADRFNGIGGEDPLKQPIPFDLLQATKQLSAYWYEHREATSEGAREMPFGVREIVESHRDWSFWC